MISRRAWLRSLALAGASFPSLARAIGERSSRFRLAQVVHGGNWNPRPAALKRLAWEIDKRTSIDVRLDPVEVRLSDPELLRYPFLYLAGEGELPPPTEEEIARLRRLLDLGGLLLVDSADARAGSPFDRGARALAARLYPQEKLARVDGDHVLLKSFYLLREGVGRVAAAPLEGLTRDRRLVLVYSPNDLGGAWERNAFGQWLHEVVPGGEGQRELAFRLGVNVAMYSLCLDYKSDQVHVQFILRRRKWRSE